jgi:uncharacterized protein GlcG (DUF336 family)
MKLVNHNSLRSKDHMKKHTLMLTIAALLNTGAAQADDPMVLPVQRLAMDMAVKAAQATIAACRKEGLSVAVTVIDRGGHSQVVLRDSLAMPITVPISKQKAYAALNFNSPTSELESRFTSPFAPPKIDGLITSAGGLPITAGSTILGGIGVSGAPSGTTDEACAAAGLKAINDDLEMAM